MMKLYDELFDLQQRLIEDYNGGVPFEQYEEDRLVMGLLLEKLELEMVKTYIKHIHRYEDNKIIFEIYNNWLSSNKKCNDISIILDDKIFLDYYLIVHIGKNKNIKKALEEWGYFDEEE